LKSNFDDLINVIEEMEKLKNKVIDIDANLIKINDEKANLN